MSNPELKIANFERMVIGEAQQRRDKNLEDISRERKSPCKNKRIKRRGAKKI